MLNPKPVPAEAVGSPFVRVWLAMGEAPAGRIRGWVSAWSTGGVDNKPVPELLQRYGASLRRECALAGFTPNCDVPLHRTSADAQAAARQWATKVTREGAY